MAYNMRGVCGIFSCGWVLGVRGAQIAHTQHRIGCCAGVCVVPCGHTAPGALVCRAVQVLGMVCEISQIWAPRIWCTHPAQIQKLQRSGVVHRVLGCRVAQKNGT